jgi:hypothetical protein
MTNVPPITFGPSGPVIPLAQDVLAGVQADINTAFGGGVNPQLSSPQGQMAQSMAAVIDDKNAQIALVSNQVNPDYSSGKWQDAIGKIYFLNRIVAAGTVVSVSCTGAVGTVIPLGATAQDTNGYIYASLGAATIPAGGSIAVQFQNQTTGAIGTAVGSVNKIYSAVIGWDAITNPAAGTLGNDVESRASFELRRQAMVAIGSQLSVDSIRAAILGVANVLDAYVIENSMPVAVNTGATNYPVIANSIFCAVVGGADIDVASAIYTKKSPGCNMNGTSLVTFTDNVNYPFPYPAYIIKFLRPTSVPILFSVQIQNTVNLPVDVVAQTQAAVVAAFNGAGGGGRARIGAAIVSGRFYAGISAIGNVNVLEVLLGISAPTLTGITMGIDQEPTVSAANITVTLV